MLSALWLLPFVLLGTALRLLHLRPQVLDGDELHAVRAAVALPLGTILTSFRQADICLPLTALDRALMDAGCALSEMAFRLPSLLAGVAALALLPRLLAGRLGGRLAGLYACLLALSPILVFYSRIARPYMPMALASLLALAAFYAWWRTGALRFAVSYVVAAALAVWLHLAAVPVVFSPFLCAALDLAHPPGGALRSLRRLALLALALLGACASFLLPARQSLAGIVAAKRQAQSVPWQTWAEVLALHAGTARPVLAILFWSAALVGLGRLFAAERRRAAATLLIAATQVAGIRLLSPVGLADPVTLDRYLLPVLPVVLLWVAAAFALPPAREGAAGRALRWTAAGAFAATLFATGPLADPVLWRSSFMHHYDFVAFFALRPTFHPEDAPAFYRDLARAPGDRPVIEYPWHPWAGLRCLHLYQQIHRRRVIVSGPERQLTAPGLALRNFVPSHPPALCATGARYLIVHVHIAREEDQVEGASIYPEVRRGLRTQGGNLAADLTALWGEPAFQDRDLRVWDLDRACAGPRPR